MSKRKGIRLAVMEENSRNNFKSYVYICQGLLTEFFTKVLDQVFSNLVREFYSNIQLEDLSQKSYIIGI